MIVLFVGVTSPFLCLVPDFPPFAITHAVACWVIINLNGKELVRVRGTNKNMGWPHVICWIPVLIVNILTLSSTKRDLLRCRPAVD